MALVLHGFRYSVYARIARLALAEKGLESTWVEVDPFAEDLDPGFLSLQPFGRVPVLVHDGFALYETAAITRYVDEAFAGPVLQPEEPRERARMAQVMGIVDSYAYRPLVRQVFSHRVFRPALGGDVDETEIKAGLAAAPTVLDALEALAGGGEGIVARQWTLADGHLAPMIAYFTVAPEGAAMLTGYPKLADWWARTKARPSMTATDPGLPG